MYIENGSKYSGRQLSSSGSFYLIMKIDKIDFNEEIICGTFNIYKSNDTAINLSTYFEAIILKSPHSLDEEIEKIREFEKNIFLDPSEYFYIKIQELFILPGVDLESGKASIDGFYYVCYYKNQDCFTGRYFYKTGEKKMSQKILLERIIEKVSGAACLI